MGTIIDKGGVGARSRAAMNKGRHVAGINVLGSELELTPREKKSVRAMLPK